MAESVSFGPTNDQATADILTYLQTGGKGADGEAQATGGSTLPPTVKKAFDTLNKHLGKDFDSLTPAEQQEVTKATQTVEGYKTFSQTKTADSFEVFEAKLSTDPKGVFSDNAEQLKGKNISSLVILNLAFGRPALSPPAGHFTNTDAIASMVEDMGSSWFTNVLSLSIKLAIIDLQQQEKTNAMDAAILEVSAMRVMNELKKEISKLTEKSYNKQAEIAMFEMISAFVTIVFSAMQMTATVGGGIAGGMGKGTGAAAGAGSGAARGASGGLQGAYHAGTASTPIGQMGSAMGQGIAAGAKMFILKEIGDIERLKVMSEAAYDAMKKTSESLHEQRSEALEHNNQMRAFVKALSEELARLFGWQR